MNFTGNAPIYETLANHYRHLIQRGAIKEGDALPSVREVALAERINPNTVVRAYGILVDEGYVVSIPKKGYFVHSSQDNKAEVIDALRLLLNEGHSISDIEEALATLREDKA